MTVLSKRRALAVALCLGLIAGLVLSSNAGASIITEFTVPTAGSGPRGITSGPDGNLWFTEQDAAGNKIGRITPGGTITEFTVPTAGSSPHSITSGPDGNIWFTENNAAGNKIGRVNLDLDPITIDEFTVPTADSGPCGITSGPDGNLWFTEQNTAGNKIGRVNLDLDPITIDEFTVPTAASSPFGITSGPDENIWFTETKTAGNKIGRVNLDLDPITIDEFTVPTASSGPLGITSGPDGNLWFTEPNAAGNRIGRVNLDLDPITIDEFTVPTAASGPFGITSGPDGNLWFTELNAAGNKIGRLQDFEPSSTPTANTCVTNGTVYAIANANGITYIGGSFTQVGPAGGTMQDRNRIAAIDATGAVTGWDPNASGGVPYCTVQALAVSGDGATVYAGGNFTTIGGKTRNKIAALNNSTGAAIDAWDAVSSSTVSALAVSGNTIYAGGSFTTIGGKTRNRIAALNNTTGAAIDPWGGAGASSTVLALAVSGDGATVYAGGMFSAIAGQTRYYIAALYATTGLTTTWDPSAGSYIFAFAVSGTTIYAGGAFNGLNSIGGHTRNYIAAIDATSGHASDWDPNASGSVRALVVSGTTVYAGGDFATIGGQTRNRIAALEPSGSAMSWNPNANGIVRALAVSGNTVYVGGEFTNIAGADPSRPYFAQFDCPSPTVTGITPNSGGYNESVSITNLAGTGFRGPTVKLTMSGQPDITATSVVVVLRTKITCTFDLDGKAAGLWNVVVTNDDGKSGTKANCFTIIAGGSITVVGTGMDYGPRAAGTTIPYDDAGGHHEVAVTVTTNCTTWAVTCASSPLVLTSTPYEIPSADFKYTSVWGGTGTPVNPTCYSNQQFSATSNIMANPSAVAANACLVDVQYWLDIPATQAAAVYTATHTYTLTVP